MSVAPPRVSLAAETLTPDTIIARLHRDLLADAPPPAVAPAQVDALIEQTVQDLWEHSRVKTFLPLLALRETRERLALVDGVSVAATSASLPAPVAPAGHAPPAASARADADRLDLANDEVLGLADDVLDLD